MRKLKISEKDLNFLASLNEKIAIEINPKWKNKQIAVLKELYNFREVLGDKMNLLNEPYVRSMDKSLLKVQKHLTEAYNLLTPAVQFYEKV